MPSPNRFASKYVAGALVLGIFSLSTGCVHRVALNDTQRAQIRSVKTIGGLSHRTLDVKIVQSSTGATVGALFGVIGVLIGAAADAAENQARLEKAQTATRPITAALAGYDTSAALGTALTEQLAPLTWLKGNTVEVRQLANPSDPKVLTRLVKESGAETVLLVELECSLTPALEALVVTARASLLSSRAGTSVEEPDRIYMSTLSTATFLPGGRGKNMPYQEAIRLWAANGGENTRRALDAGIAEISQMLAFDLQQAGDSGSEGPGRVERRNAIDAQGALMAGQIVHKTGDREWVRLPAGQLLSMPARQPQAGATARR